MKALFLDTETDEVVSANGIRLVSDKTRIGGALAEALDQDEVDSLIFTGYNNLVPALGFEKWDGHIFVSGATGSGKSYLINAMLMKDHKQRNVYLFTDHTKVDPSLKPMVESGRMFIVRSDPDDEKEWEITQGEFARGKEGNIIMFDDCTDPAALFMRDNALRKARHQNISVICVNHKMRDHQATKHMLTNARFLIAFPNANRGAIANFMKDQLEMASKARRAVLRLAAREGRQIVFHMQCPNVIASARTVMQI